MSKGKVTPRISDSIYILPNLFTTGNLFFGYYSIISSIKGDFTTAAIAILLAGIFDILDGSIARLAKASSSFGIQYDSLCDLVSFGVAPVVLMHQYSLHSFGRVAFAVSFIFIACGALRLARFNVVATEKSMTLFVGLPIPTPAALIATFVAFIESLKTVEGKEMFSFFPSLHTLLLSEKFLAYFLVVFSLLLAFCMVSNILYRSLKSFDIHCMSSFRLSVIIVLLLAVVLYRPALVGFLIFFIYVLSGPFEFLMGWQEA